jgi:hypothetical protein
MKEIERKLIKRIAEIKNSDDWYAIEKEFFNSQVLKEKKISDFGFSRPSKEISISGITWESFEGSYENKQLYFLYEKYQQVAFEMLEPEAAFENSQNPSEYGKICYICEIKTRENSPSCCPICKGELLFWLIDNAEAE